MIRFQESDNFALLHAMIVNDILNEAQIKALLREDKNNRALKILLSKEGYSSNFYGDKIEALLGDQLRASLKITC